MTSTVSGAPIVETTAGRIRGAMSDGIASFKGVPYGAPTGGQNRFMPPQRPQPWDGTRDALQYGPMAPQSIPGAPPSATAALEGATGVESEDCLYLNVFTPGVTDGLARPTMVWLHGGGFVSGSGGPAYDGSNLARRGDVVVVTINHRLGALGYAHLGDLGGGTYASSGNAGMLDIVAGLEWVRDNIAAFGGDPGNVTIFGESGGGRKVTALLAMPPAHGLFHRAIIESGPGIRVNERDYATQLSRAFMEECAVSQVEELQDLSLERILAAQGAMPKRMPSSNARGGFRPVIDPVNLPAHPFDPVGPEMSASVPVMVGFNRTEATLFLANDKEAFELDEAGLMRRTERIFKEEAPRLLDRMRALHPDASPSDLYLLIHTQFLRYPIDSIKLAERRAEQGGAPVYLYRFDWQTPARFGQLRTPHALEIPFVFDNTELGAWRGFTRGTPEAAALAAKVSATWAAFARSGDPNGAGLPEWRPYDTNDRSTMVIDNESALVEDPDSGERELFDDIFFRARA